jgi:hypothetical protein
MTPLGVLIHWCQVTCHMKYCFNGGIWLLRFEP